MDMYQNMVPLNLNTKKRIKNDDEIKKIMNEKMIKKMDIEDKDSSMESEIEKEIQYKRIQKCSKNYLEYDDQIRLKRKEIRELTKKRKEEEQEILDLLIKNFEEDERVINHKNGNKLRAYVSKSKGTLTKDIMKKALGEKIKDNKIIEAMIKRMDDLRPIKETIKLKRTMKKTKK